MASKDEPRMVEGKAVITKRQDRLGEREKGERDGSERVRARESEGERYLIDKVDGKRYGKR